MLRVKKEGKKPVEVPQAVVAEGSEAIEAYVASKWEKKPSGKSSPKTTSQEG